MNDISIHAALLNTSFDAAIISIAAQRFDRLTGKLGDKLYVEVDFGDAIKWGTVNGNTLAWWVSQGENYRSIFSYKGMQNKKPMYHCLKVLAEFINDSKDLRLWGPVGHFAALETAYRRTQAAGHGQAVPWNQSWLRDHVTLADVAGLDLKKVLIPSTHHNALDDAIQQAKTIIEATKLIEQPSLLSATQEDDEL